MLAACVFLSGPAMAGAHSTTGPVVVAFGDSLTQGYGLFEDDGFVPQLRRWLVENGAPPLRVVNAGVSGDTSAGGLSRIAWTLTPDVDAIIVALGGNDMLRGIDPAVTRANIDGILAAAKEAQVPALLVGQQAPGNFGPAYADAFNAIWPDMGAKYGVLWVPSFFVGLGDAPDPASLQPLLQPDGIHPNATGVARIVEGLGPYVLQLLKQLPEGG